MKRRLGGKTVRALALQRANPGAVMAGLVRKFDWSKTPLGPIADWSPSLQTAVGICINSYVPTVVWWGPDMINIYNDAYAVIMRERHPAGLGRPARDVWPEAWPVIGPELDGVMRGEPVYRERVRFNIPRPGGPDEERRVTYSMSPIPDGHGGIGGVFKVVNEETARVRSERRKAKAEKRLRDANAALDRDLAQWQAVIGGISEGVIVADAAGNLLDWNRAAMEMHGYTDPQQGRRNLSEIATHFLLRTPQGAPVPFEQWPMSRLLRGEKFRNLELCVRREDDPRELSVAYSGTLIRNNKGDVVMALLTLHETGPVPERRIHTDSAPAVAPTPAAVEGEMRRLERMARDAAEEVEQMLWSMDLSLMERKFAKAVGEKLADDAIDAYVVAAKSKQGYDGSCITAAIAVALMIVRESE